MEFKIFENKIEHLEYLQIFVYSELIIQGKKNVNIADYNAFELTDTIVHSYNKSIAKLNYKASKVNVWFDENQDQVEYFKNNFHTIFHPKVSIWSDRIKTTYYKEKLQDAFLFENYIAKLIEQEYGLDMGQYLSPKGQYELGENALGIEIKNDTLINKYGNVYIEYQEKSKGSNTDFVNSGILKTDNCTYFLTGTAEKFYIFRKDKLISIFIDEKELRDKKKPSLRNIKFKQIATSKGYAYPVKSALSDTITMDEMINEIKLKLGL